MQYTYDAQNPNLLLKVFDYSNSPQGFKDDGDGISDHENDYKYDTFGNLIKDDNKNIESITYNHLNLPVKIIFHNGNISYLYTATGQKIKKVVSSRETITTDYLGSFQYFNNNLKHIPHAEGYVNVVNGKFKHVFNFTDHLGNIRLSYSDANRDNLITHDEILEENNFYPFGLKHTVYNTNERQYINNDQINELILILFPRFTGDGRYNYKYNGKEYQDELGLNMYDYGARNYDPSIGRWMNIDPLTDVLSNLSPYNYVKNNPVKFIDPNGMIWLDQLEADKLKGNITNKISSLNNEKSELNALLNDENLSEKERSKILKSISNIDSRVKSLNTSISDIDKLGADENNTYDLVSGGEINNVKKGQNDVVVIQGPNDALQIHEIRHVSLSLSSEKGLEFSFGGFLKVTTDTGALDEISGYRAQYSYEPSSMPGSVSEESEINIKYIANIRDNNNKLVYPNIYQRWKNQQKQEKLNEKNEKSKKKQGQ